MTTDDNNKDDNVDNDNSVGCLLPLVDFVAMFSYPLWLGYVISVVWNWHIAGWHELPVLGYATAASVCLIFNLARPKKLVDTWMKAKLLSDETKAIYEREQRTRIWIGLTTKIFGPMITIAIAWVMT